MRYGRLTAGLGAALILAATNALAWNTPPKHVNALRFLKDGSIWFTMFDQGAGGSEFRCNADDARRGQWLIIEACESSSPISAGEALSDRLSRAAPTVATAASGGSVAQCHKAVDRMASMLLAAKLAGKAVHVQRETCIVTEVALKP